MARTVFFDNCGASPNRPGTLAVVRAHLAREADIGGYAAESEAHLRLESVYDAIESLIRAERGTVALTPSATQAWLQAFHGQDWQAGEEVLTHQSEYRANVIALEDAKRRYGIRVTLVPSFESGAIDLAALEAMISSRTKLIALTWLPSNDGLINPAEQVGAIARAHGVPYLLDACQAVGQMPVDVHRLDCTYLCATGRKFLRAPRGTGFLYVKRSAQDRHRPPFIDHQAQAHRGSARRFELYERSIALQLGLGDAARAANDLDTGFAHISRLASRARSEINHLPGWRVLDRGELQSGIVTFMSNHHAPDIVKAALRDAGIASSVSGQAFAPYDPVMPHSYNRIGLHTFNTDTELDRFLTVLDALQ